MTSEEIRGAYNGEVTPFKYTESGAASLFFGVVGFFVVPVGLINGLVFIVTGDSLEQYF